MARKTGLGRGLDALIPSGDGSSDNTGTLSLPIDSIQPNPRQPRAHMDSEELEELAASIREHGVIQPLIVTRGLQFDSYILIAGERRLMAARKAGLTYVPVLLREATEQQLLELALVENVQRADLNPLEAAEAYRQLTEDFGLSHEEVSARVGKSRTAVTNTLRLLKLPESVQKSLAEGLISEGHARSLLSLPTPQSMAVACQTVIRQGLNVRQTEELVRHLSGQRDAPKPKEALPPELFSLEERLRDGLGTKVSLHPTRSGGTLVIHYYSDEELDTLTRKILGE